MGMRNSAQKLAAKAAGDGAGSGSTPAPTDTLPTVDDITVEVLFDRLPDVVFFVKDRDGRYRTVNQSLARRCGVAHKEAILGRTAEELFPGALGRGYAAQDRQVLDSGVELRDRLELHRYPGGATGWCLTTKVPLRTPAGAVAGLVGISRDLHRPDERHPEVRRLARAVARLESGYDAPLRLTEVAREAGLSLDRFERLARRVFGVTPRQLLTKARIGAASRLLREGRLTVAEVAYACGYSDHSAFTRQFRATVGVPPSAYRRGAQAPTPGRQGSAPSAAPGARSAEAPPAARRA